MKTKEKINEKKMEIKNNLCSDRDCQFHGYLRTRGRMFQGTVVNKFDRRITIILERMVYLNKYERYMKSRTKIHARLPACMKEQVNIGDLVRVQECRPLSKIIHHTLVEVVRKQ